MIIYTDKCIACYHRKRVREIKRMCERAGIKIEERRIGFNEQWRQEAESYGLPMPFLVYEGKAYGMYADMEGIL